MIVCKVGCMHADLDEIWIYLSVQNLMELVAFDHRKLCKGFINIKFLKFDRIAAPSAVLRNLVRYKVYVYM